MRLKTILIICCLSIWIIPSVSAQNTRATDTYKRIRAYLDSIPAIDTHDHFPGPERFTHHVQTEYGHGMNLWSLFNRSYYKWTNPVLDFKPNQPFMDWWREAKGVFDDTRCVSFYRYQLPAFKDLYGVDFDTITDEQAAKLDRQIYDNYKKPNWIQEVITERANIEIVVNDPHWNPFGKVSEYPFTTIVQPANHFIKAFHPEVITRHQHKNPYNLAKKKDRELKTLDDYVKFIDWYLAERKKQGVVGLKCSLAYERTIRFENVSKERAAKAFGRPPSEVSPQEKKDFEDYIMWRLVEMSAKYDLPFQIHTGHARIQGSDPMLLVDMIAANPNTKFILFHGGFPWIDSIGVIPMRHKNVWLDSCWLPTLSYSMAKRAYHEWLEMMPSTRIMWGADSGSVESVYGSTMLTRQCLAEVLAEKINRGDLIEEHAQRIGRQILRDNALQIFPAIKQKLWKHKGKLKTGN